MNKPRYCDLCDCICVACVQLANGCDSCALLHPELITGECPFTEALIDHFESRGT